MIYVVSGLPRHGTSMLMQAGEAGGLSARYSHSRNTQADGASDGVYHGNRAGLFELNNRERKAFLTTPEDGALVKLMAHHIEDAGGLPDGHLWSVVWMHRDAEEATQSLQAFQGPHQHWRDTAEHERQVRAGLDYLHSRDDVVVTELWYPEVVADPIGQLSKIPWPLDVGKAATIVDPDQYRYRRELLTAGIPL